MAALPIRLRCACGTAGAWSAAADQAWACPSCGRGWVPDPAALDAVAAAAGQLRRLRRLVLIAVAATLVVAGVVVAIHPQWVLGVPVLVGGVLLALQPTYKKRRARAVRDLPRGIPLTAA